MNRVTTTITLLATEATPQWLLGLIQRWFEKSPKEEVAPPAEDAATYMFNPRINSSSFDPALAKSKQSLRSRRSSRLQANLDNQFQADVPVVEEELRHQAVGEEQEQSRPRSDEGLKSAWI
ncbi:unnamed protein product [Durusdinium trenchii]|uniref:Uncharacterized protein n=1 Tax=Durusdinium trenchii TaxID=1381693 RepID=A0ABP0R0P0_9DINO